MISCRLIFKLINIKNVDTLVKNKTMFCTDTANHIDPNTTTSSTDVILIMSKNLI